MNGMFGNADGDNIQPPNPNRYISFPHPPSRFTNTYPRYFALQTADIVIPYMPAWHLYWDYWVITDCARELGGWEEKFALSVATEILNTFR